MRAGSHDDSRVMRLFPDIRRYRPVMWLLVALLAGLSVSCADFDRATGTTSAASTATTAAGEGSSTTRSSEQPTLITSSLVHEEVTHVTTHKTSERETSERETSERETSERETSEREQLADRIGRMTIEEKIGQLLIFGYESIADAETVIRDLNPGGVILFGRNIQSIEQTRSDIARLQAVAAESGVGQIPLFISVDQEGGRVSRLPAESGLFESAREIGIRDDPAGTFAFGERTAVALAELGFNLDYAPVLDIDSNPLNPVIGDRSFSSTADGVTRHGLAMLSGIEAGGVIACIKHFPGHGDTHVDSHIGLPIVRKSLADLEAFELVPFTAAIEEGASMVMVAHLLVEAMDHRPASLSPVLVNDLLRGKMGYQGVVITDDLTMGAVVEHYSLGEAAIMAVEAGCDLLPVCHGTDRLRGTQAALLDAWRSGRLTEARIDQSVLRILQLKLKWFPVDGLIGSLVDKPADSLADSPVDGLVDSPVDSLVDSPADDQD